MRPVPGRHLSATGDNPRSRAGSNALGKTSASRRRPSRRTRCRCPVNFGALNRKVQRCKLSIFAAALIRNGVGAWTMRMPLRVDAATAHAVDPLVVDERKEPAGGGIMSTTPSYSTKYVGYDRFGAEAQSPPPAGRRLPPAALSAGCEPRFVAKRSSVGRWHEHIAHPTHGADRLRVCWVEFDLAAQARDAQVDSAVERLHLAVCGHLQQPVAL